MPRDFGPDARARRGRDLWILVAVALLGLTGRLIYLQLFRGSYYRTLSETEK